MDVTPPGGWLVLCSAADASAVWVYEQLRSRGRVPVGLLFVEALAHGGVRWEHRVGARGAALTLTTGDGRTLRGCDVGAVLNRLAIPPFAVLDAAEPADREYARSELAAFAASWLRTLGVTVLNAPDPHGLCGRWRQPLEWRWLAVRAGMPSVPLRLVSADAGGAPLHAGNGDGPSTTVLAVDGHILHSGVGSELQRACARLCALSRTRVLGLRFDGADPARAGWRLLDATPFPDLSLAGDTGIAALAEALAA